MYLSLHPCFEQIEFLRELYAVSFDVSYLLVEKIENDTYFRLYFELMWTLTNITLQRYCSQLVSRHKVGEQLDADAAVTGTAVVGKVTVNGAFVNFGMEPKGHIRFFTGIIRHILGNPVR